MCSLEKAKLGIALTHRRRQVKLISSIIVKFSSSFTEASPGRTETTDRTPSETTNTAPSYEPTQPAPTIPENDAAKAQSSAAVATTETKEVDKHQHTNYHGTLSFEEEEDSPLVPKLPQALPPDPVSQFFQSPIAALNPPSTTISAPLPTSGRKNLIFARRLISIVLGFFLSFVVHVALIVEANPLAYADGSWQYNVVWAFASDDGYFNLHHWAILWPWITCELALHIFLFLPNVNKKVKELSCQEKLN